MKFLNLNEEIKKLKKLSQLNPNYINKIFKLIKDDEIDNYDIINGGFNPIFDFIEVILLGLKRG
jgi:hypothetical protein